MRHLVLKNVFNAIMVSIITSTLHSMIGIPLGAQIIAYLRIAQSSYGLINMMDQLVKVSMWGWVHLILKYAASLKI